jgi:hypothetical protein
VSAPQTYRYRSLRRPAQVVIGVLILGIVVDAIALIVEVDYYSVLDELDRGIDVSVADIQAADDRSAAAGLAQIVSYIPAIVAFIVWFARAYRNTAGLGATGMRRKPGWSIGAWFVPILNLFRPKQIANDIWRATDPALPRVASGWQGNAVHGLIHWWWAIWIMAGVSGNLSTRVYLNAETLSEQLGASAFSAFADVVFIAAAVLAILVVRRVTGRQEQRAAMLSAPEPQAPPEPLPLQPA